MEELRAPVKFGKIVREMRLKRNWTQDYLAAELGVDAAFISRIERGMKNPSLETVLRLASALNVKLRFGDKTL